MAFVLLTSDFLGTGDEALGRKLMKNFLGQLVEQGVPVEEVGLLNRAVFLACEGSEVLEPLRTLEGRGTRILACITCLEHYGLDTKLAVGEIGTMAGIVKASAAAGKVLSP